VQGLGRGLSRPDGQQPVQRQRLLAGQRHALTKDRVHTAHHVAQRQQPGRKTLDLVKALPDLLRVGVPDRRGQGLRVSQRLVQVGHRQAAGESQKVLGRGARMGAGIAKQGDDPVLVVQRQHDAAARRIRQRVHRQAFPVLRRLAGGRRLAINPADVDQVNRRRFLGRRGIALGRQPAQHARATTTGVHHQVGQQLVGLAFGLETQPTHPPRVGAEQQALHPAAAHQRHPDVLPHPSPDARLQRRPPLRVEVQAAGCSGFPATVLEPAQLLGPGHAFDTVLLHVGQEARKALRQRLQPAVEQHMHMLALRHTLARRGVAGLLGVGQCVAVQHRDCAKVP